MTEDEVREDNPSTLLEGPKLGLYLPDTLSFEDVEKILNKERKEVHGEEWNIRRAEIH